MRYDFITLFNVVIVAVLIIGFALSSAIIAYSGDVSKDYVFYGETLVPSWWITEQPAIIVTDSYALVNITNNDVLFAKAHKYPDPLKNKNGYIDAVNDAVKKIR